MKFFNAIIKRKHVSLFKKFDLKTIIRADNDPIISRKMNQEKLELIFKKLPQEENFINLGFYFLEYDKFLGSYQKRTDKNLWNFLSIGLERIQPVDFLNHSLVNRTVRHELQHFTQAYYGDLFEIDKTIGNPPGKKRKSGTEEYYSSSGLYQDIPNEMIPVIQDNIEELIDDLRIIRKKGLINKLILKKAIINFIRNSEKVFWLILFFCII